MVEVVICREAVFLLLQFLFTAVAASSRVAEKMASNVIDAPLDDVIKQKRSFGNRRGFRGGARGRGGRGGNRGGGVKRLSTGKKFGVKNFGSGNGTPSDLRDRLAKKEVGDLRQRISTPKTQPLQVKTIQSVPANNKRQPLRAGGRSRAMTTGGMSNRQPQNVPTFQLSHEEMKKIQITVPGRNRPVEVRVTVTRWLEVLKSKLPCQRLNIRSSLVLAYCIHSLLVVVILSLVFGPLSVM